MGSNLAEREPRSDLARRWGMTNAQLEVLRRVIHPDAPDDVIELYLAKCRSLGADPSDKVIYVIPRRSNVKDERTGEWRSEIRWQLQGSIDLFRSIAENSGDYAGQLGPFWSNDGETWKDVWLEPVPPRVCKIGVLRQSFKEPLWVTGTYDYYCPRDSKGNFTPGNFWKGEKGAHQLAKCVEELALRKAFPRKLHGVYGSEEMQQAPKPATKSSRSARTVSEIRYRVAHRSEPGPRRARLPARCCRSLTIKCCPRLYARKCRRVQNPTRTDAKRGSAQSTSSAQSAAFPTPHIVKPWFNCLAWNVLLNRHRTTPRSRRSSGRRAACLPSPSLKISGALSTPCASLKTTQPKRSESYGHRASCRSPRGTWGGARLCVPCVACWAAAVTGKKCALGEGSCVKFSKRGKTLSLLHGQKLGNTRATAGHRFTRHRPNPGNKQCLRGGISSSNLDVLSSSSLL